MGHFAAACDVTTAQYLEALRELGLSPYGAETRAALGLARSQIARLATGETRPTRMLELLLKMYLRHGV